MPIPADQHDCALCEKQATSRCSGCKRIWFCGPQCQKTIWPVHKALCSADPDVFRQAPLSKTELADFRKAGNAPYAQGPGSRSGGMLFKDSFESEVGGWEDLLQLLLIPVKGPSVAPASGLNTDDDEEAFDMLREDMLIMARFRLGLLYDYTNGDLRDPPESLPWLEMAQILASISIIYRTEGAEIDGPVTLTAASCRELNAFLRQQLITCAIHHHIFKAKTVEAVKPWVPLILLARDRAIAAVERAALSPGVDREALRALVANKYEDMRELGFGPDRKMRPALHP